MLSCLMHLASLSDTEILHLQTRRESLKRFAGLELRFAKAIPPQDLLRIKRHLRRTDDTRIAEPPDGDMSFVLTQAVAYLSAGFMSRGEGGRVGSVEEEGEDEAKAEVAKAPGGGEGSTEAGKATEKKQDQILPFKDTLDTLTLEEDQDDMDTLALEEDQDDGPALS